MDERQARTAAAVKAAGADWGVLASVDGVAYASGHVVPVEAGPSPFAGGPTLALVGGDGTLGIVCANVEGQAAAASRADVVETYEGYAFDHVVDYVDAWREAVGRLVRRLGVGGRVAAERGFGPPGLDDLLPVDPGLDLVPGLRRARATKTEAELAALARCAEAVAIGQARSWRPSGRAAASSPCSPTSAAPSRSSPAPGCRSPATSSPARNAPPASQAGRSTAPSSTATR